MPRKFGVEIECFHRTVDTYTSQQELPGKIREAAGVTAIQASYTGRSYDRWQVKTDSSITPSGYGVEIVSRILDAGDAGYLEVSKVARMLDSENYRVNRSTGLHVHISTDDLSREEIAAVALRYALHIDEINSFLPPSRRNNSYCTIFPHTEQVLLESIAKKQSRGFPSSRGAVNLLHAPGRIEFRQAGGTVDENKIINWVKFLVEFIETTVTLVRTEAVERITQVQYTELERNPEYNRPAPVVWPRTRNGSRTELLLGLFREQGTVRYSDMASMHGWSRLYFTDVVAALRAMGVPVEKVRAGVYRLATPTAPSVPEFIEVTRTREERQPCDVRAILRRAFLPQMSPETQSWVEARKRVFQNEEDR